MASAPGTPGFPLDGALTPGLAPSFGTPSQSGSSAPRTPGTLAPRVEPSPAIESSVGPKSGGGASAGVGLSRSTFLCVKCRLQKPLSLMRPVGAQMWCEDDKSAYNNLTIRWKTNAKLKKWWQGLSEQQQIGFFIKWQRLDKTSRFEAIKYCERAVETHELLEDEIDLWIPYATFYREKKSEGLSQINIEALWRDSIESNRAQCKFVRNEWLLPRFEGLRRTSRHRLSQEIEAVRTANINDPGQMEALWTAGQQTLSRFKLNIPQTIVSESNNLPPPVNANPADMPVLPEAQDVVKASIIREVSGLASPPEQPFLCVCQLCMRLSKKFEFLFAKYVLCLRDD